MRKATSNLNSTARRSAVDHRARPLGPIPNSKKENDCAKKPVNGLI